MTRKIPERLMVRLLPIHVFASNITMLYGSRDQINAYFQRHYPKDPGRPCLDAQTAGNFTAYRMDGGSEKHYISVRRLTDQVAVMGALHHEVMHCVAYTFRVLGLPLTDSSEEAYTYFGEWIFRQCLMAMTGRTERRT